MKKIVNSILIVCMIGLYLSAEEVEAATFTDVTKNADAIDYLHTNDIITGYDDGTFRPKQPVTRLQAVRMLLKAQGVTDMTAPDPGLTDMTPGKHGYETVAKAVQLGIISGKKNPDGTSYFDPSGKLTRAQMAKIIVESQKLPIHSKYSFTDLPKTSGYYNYVSTLASTRITEGYEDGTYRPNINVSREHFSLFVARMLDDSFKPVLPSFINDKEKTYAWKYYDEGITFETKSTFVEMRTIGGQQWQLWKESGSNSDDSFFLLYEDEEGLYEDACFAFNNKVECNDISKSTFNAIQYPLIVNSKWLISSYEGYFSEAKIKARNQTVKVPAGTFTGVVVVEEEDGWVYYYAPHIGLIKSEENGVLFSELTKVTR